MQKDRFDVIFANQPMDDDQDQKLEDDGKEIPDESEVETEEEKEEEDEEE